MLDAYLYDGLRSPIGRHGGSLATVRADDLAATLIARLTARAGFPKDAYEDVILGSTNQAGEDSRNVARYAGLLAGLPIETGGQTVNRLCASGLAAVIEAARAVTCGEGELFVAGGVENMSRAPFVLGKAESAFSREAKIFDSTMGARFPNPRFTTQFGDDTMPQTADNIARDLGITRAASDAFALRSQQNYAATLAAGFFAAEIETIELPGKRKDGSVAVFAADEHPRPQTDAAGLAKLKPLQADGVVTAGNASGINDGAAMLIVGSRQAGERHGIRPRGRILAAAAAGVAPRVMGLGPVPASAKALQRAGLKLADMDVIEINEAFATQVLGCTQQMGLAGDDQRLNPNGGAIAIGHPLGCSGARLALTALRQLERTGGRYALVTLCIGIGQGLAAIIERVEK
ncbi:MAG TPA: 3-oxoadipyl-CoA thiolase [Alphaproteobacteria bacterium]|nr:3-oxoadipyl-CoA thiolase [Alphaproteobacteria bacterium]